MFGGLVIVYVNLCLVMNMDFVVMQRVRDRAFKLNPLPIYMRALRPSLMPLYVHDGNYSFLGLSFVPTICTTRPALGSRNHSPHLEYTWTFSLPCFHQLWYPSFDVDVMSDFLQTYTALSSASPRAEVSTVLTSIIDGMSQRSIEIYPILILNSMKLRRLPWVLVPGRKSYKFYLTTWRRVVTIMGIRAG
jgi:hypothetical protein